MGDRLKSKVITVRKPRVQKLTKEQVEALRYVERAMNRCAFSNCKGDVSTAKLGVRATDITLPVCARCADRARKITGTELVAWP